MTLIAFHLRPTGEIQHGNWTNVLLCPNSIPSVSWQSILIYHYWTLAMDFFKNSIGHFGFLLGPLLLRELSPTLEFEWDILKCLRN